ncbi:MAG: hemin uptake protein HemP [Rhizobiales bacterium]|nr:hemin uptake protein HemP [Hyphomicrobiales bacterium]
MQARLARSRPVADHIGPDHIGIDRQAGEMPGLHALSLLPEQPLKTYGSRELFGTCREVGIEHGGSLYRLKITRQGKLILNK